MFRFGSTISLASRGTIIAVLVTLSVLFTSACDVDARERRGICDEAPWLCR